MAGSVIQAPSRLYVSDPQTNAAIQDLYNKLQQLSNILGGIQNQLNGVSPQSLFTQQNVVTLKRGFSAVYQNTGKGPMLVVVSSTQTSPDYQKGFTDSSKNPITEVARNTPLSMLVLPGNYYKVVPTVVANVVLVDWVEWL